MTARNTNVYGQVISLNRQDRVRVSSIRVTVYDGDTTQPLSCTNYIGTRTGGTLFSTTRYVCSSSNGCATVPSASFTGQRELRWNNPFGSNFLVNQGAVNIGSSCIIPKNSSIYYLRGVFSAN